MTSHEVRLPSSPALPPGFSHKCQNDCSHQPWNETLICPLMWCMILSFKHAPAEYRISLKCFLTNTAKSHFYELLRSEALQLLYMSQGLWKWLLGLVLTQRIKKTQCQKESHVLCWSHLFAAAQEAALQREWHRPGDPGLLASAVMEVSGQLLNPGKTSIESVPCGWRLFSYTVPNLLIIWSPWRKQTYLVNYWL